MKFTNKKIEESLQNIGSDVRMEGNAYKEMRAFLLSKVCEDKRNEMVLKEKIKIARDWMGLNWVSVRVATIGIVVLSVLGGSITTVSASLQSLPGDFLFPIKRTTEKLQVAIAKDENSKTKLKMEFAGRRLEEAKKIMQNENTEKEAKEAKVVLAMANFKTQIDSIKEYMANVAPSEETESVSSSITELNTEAEKIAEANASGAPKQDATTTEVFPVADDAREAVNIKTLPIPIKSSEDSEESFEIKLQMIEEENPMRIEF